MIISTGTVRGGGTANAFLPQMFPAVPTSEVFRELVDAAEQLAIPYTTGEGVAADAFYDPNYEQDRELYIKSNLVSVEMESDTLYILGQYNGWRTGAAFASDGSPSEIKPEWGKEKHIQGGLNCIDVALEAMYNLAMKDQEK